MCAHSKWTEGSYKNPLVSIATTWSWSRAPHPLVCVLVLLPRRFTSVWAALCSEDSLSSCTNFRGLRFICSWRKDQTTAGRAGDPPTPDSELVPLVSLSPLLQGELSESSTPQLLPSSFPVSLTGNVEAIKFSSACPELIWESSSLLLMSVQKVPSV